jgi:hypothetical protein
MRRGSGGHVSRINRRSTRASMRQHASASMRYVAEFALSMIKAAPLRGAVARPSPGSAFGTPARHGRARSQQLATDQADYSTPTASTASPPSSSASIVRLAAAASRAALRAVARQCRVVKDQRARSRKIPWRRVGGRRNRISSRDGVYFVLALGTFPHMAITEEGRSPHR